ncbi:MAG: protein adenylyltransferase SelO [Kofleriaceae bacterium]
MRDLTFADRFVRDLPGDPRSDNTLRQVHNACFTRVVPTAVSKPALLYLVPEVAQLLDLDTAESPELVEVLAGNRVIPGMAPYAACYGGHQFGTWAGQLGDGRAITLAEVVNYSGDSWEIQLKGAGPTPYSRRADGRAVLRSSLRELVCSEAMFHLGVPTTRALSLVATGDLVERDMLYDGHPRMEPGAVVCRVAPTFLRFGNFELPTARDDVATLERLVNFTIERFYRQHANSLVSSRSSDNLNRGRPGVSPGCDVPAFFHEVMQRTAFMVAEWMRVGFVHGVMNTDNMSILGLTIDYGPYGWIEPFDLDWTPNTTDAQQRRYRFGSQPQVAQWNLAMLARALAPVVGDMAALRASLEAFSAEFSSLHRHSMLRKLGLAGRADTQSDDDELLTTLAALLVEIETDMTLFFRRLTGPLTVAQLEPAYYAPLTDVQRDRVTRWLAAYAQRIRAEKIDERERAERMNAINPLYVPRNYVVQRVIDATEAGDRAALPELMDVLRHPYTEQPGKERFAEKRPEWARSKVGCSMLSCSS